MTGGGFSAWAQALPNGTRGAMWALAAAIAFGTMEVMVKLIGAALHPFQIAFFRSLVALLTLMPLFVAYGRALFNTRRLGGHFLRAILGYASMTFGFFALVHLPLAEAVALGYVRGLFLVPLAVMLLGETTNWRRWLAMGCGFAGVLVMLRPGAGVFDPAAIFALLAGFFVAFVSVFMKRLSETERPQVIIFWFAAFTTLLAAGPAIAVWRWPEPALWPAVLALGVLGSLGQYCIVRAFRIADATAVDSVDYTRLIYSAGVGMLVFGEALTLPTVAGALIIAASTLYIARQGAGKSPPP